MREPKTIPNQSRCGEDGGSRAWQGSGGSGEAKLSDLDLDPWPRLDLRPGWKVALEALGESGAGIARIWAVRDDGEMGEEDWTEFGEELRLGTRWRRYGRCGEVCALLRQAGRRERPRKA
jgi:hypothetical protein